MSQENMTAVEASIAAYNARDWDRAVARFAPDVEWRDASEHPDRKEVVGPGAAIEHLRARLDVVASVFDVDRIVDHDEKVVGVGRLRAGGISREGEVRAPFALVFTFETGRVVRVEEFRNHDVGGVGTRPTITALGAISSSSSATRGPPVAVAR
jgi:ketosteroid isomerase-like protein